MHVSDDSDPYSPGKEAEPYSPGQEAAADEPYDPGDGGLMNQSDVPVSSVTVSSSTAPSSVQPATAAEQPVASVAVNNPTVVEAPATGETTAAQKGKQVLCLSPTYMEVHLFNIDGVPSLHIHGVMVV